MIPALAGANIIYGMGMIELGVTFSFTQLIIDDMIIDRIKNLIQADFGMNRISDPGWLKRLLRKGFPSGVWCPQRVRGRKTPEELTDSFPETKNIEGEARQKVQNIINSHKPEPLPPAVVTRIREIILEAEEGRELPIAKSKRHNAI